MTRPLAAGAVAAAVLLVYGLRLDQAAGLFVDDAWYLVLAKALREGEGFRLISSATVPILPAFPPGFAMLLAPVWAGWPEFPANVTAFKILSVAAMLGVGWLSYAYLARRRCDPPAAVVAVAVMLMPAFVFLATSTVMAEPVFALGQLSVAVLIERAVDRQRGGHTATVVLSGLVAGATLLVRLAGVAGVVAGAAYLAARRGWRAAAMFSVVAATCYLPWGLYARAHQPSEEERLAHGGSVAHSYSQLLLMRYGGEAREGWVTLGEIPRRVLTNAGDILGRDVGAMILPAAYRGPAESGQEVFGMTGDTTLRASSMGGSRATFWLSLALSLVAAVGFFVTARRRVRVSEVMVVLTVAMVVLVPARTFRYVLPLAPFILWYFFTGIESLVSWLRRREAEFGAPFRVAAACVLAMFVAEHAQYVTAPWTGTPLVWRQEQEEVDDLTAWMRIHLQPAGHVASNNPGLIYLATGRRGVSMGEARQNWDRWYAGGVRYAVAVHPAEKPPRALGYQVRYESPTRRLWVLELLPPDRK